jgi:O-antigen ligase
MFTGVGNQKNALGLMCLISAFFYFWTLLFNREDCRKFDQKEWIIQILLLLMTGYLLYISRSATSQACAVVAGSLFFAARTKPIVRNPKSIVILTVAFVSLFAVLDMFVDLTGIVLSLLGRDATLTNRTSVWQLVGSHAVNPLIGSGFMSFWAGARMRLIWDQLGAGINQAHNGYLEQYLNLGYIGVAFIGAIILSALVKIRKHLSIDYKAAMPRFVLIVVAVLYNYTEASFYGINNMWILTLIACIAVPIRNDVQTWGQSK